jgi:hypothetical protein
MRWLQKKRHDLILCVPGKCFTYAADAGMNVASSAIAQVLVKIFT